MPSVVSSADPCPELGAAVAAIMLQAGGWSAGRIAAELDVIRRSAAAGGLGPAVNVIHALDSALARGETGPLVQGWLAILADAVAAPAGGNARQALTAACAVRLAG
jgi:hypothetical protein